MSKKKKFLMLSEKLHARYKDLLKEARAYKRALNKQIRKEQKEGRMTLHGDEFKAAKAMFRRAEKAYYDYVDVLSAERAAAKKSAEIAAAMQEWLAATEAEIAACEVVSDWDTWQKADRKQQRAEATKAAKTTAAAKAKKRYEEWLHSERGKETTAAKKKLKGLEEILGALPKAGLQLLSETKERAVRKQTVKEFISYNMFVGGARLRVTHIKGSRYHIGICDGESNTYQCEISFRRLKRAAKAAVKRIAVRKNLSTLQKLLVQEKVKENLLDDLFNCEFYKSKDYNVGFIEKFEKTFTDKEPSLAESRRSFSKFEASFFEGVHVPSLVNTDLELSRNVHLKTDEVYKTNLEKLGEQYLGARGTECEGRKLPKSLPSRVLFAGLGSKNPQMWVFFDDDKEGVWYFHADGYLYARKDNRLYEKFKVQEYKGHALGRLLNNAILKKQAAEENIDECIDDAFSKGGDDEKAQITISSHRQLQNHWQEVMRKPKGKSVTLTKLTAHTKWIEGEPVELTDVTVCDLAHSVMVEAVENTIFGKWTMAQYDPRLFKFVDRHSRAMLVVNLNGISDVDRLADREMQVYREIVCLVPVKQSRPDLFYVRKMNPVTGEIYFESWFDQYDRLTEEEFEKVVSSPEFLGYWYYDGEFAVTSPGQVKNHDALLAGKWIPTKEEAEDWSVDWESLYNAIFGDAWRLWINDPNKRGYKEVSQFATRMAHWTAPATTFPETPAGSFALFNGKFTSKYIKDRNGELVEYEDGQDFINVAFMQRAFNRSDSRFHITRSALLFQLFQHRSWAYCNKSDGWVIDDEGMELLFKRHGKKIERIKLWELSDEDKAFWDYFMQTKGKVGSCPREDWIQKLKDLKGAIIIFYANKKDYSDTALTADLFTDWNSLKCGFRPWKTVPYLKILAMSHDGGTQQVLSSQLIQTLVAGDPDKAWKLILGLMAVEIDKQLEKFYGQKDPERSYSDFARLTKIEYGYNGEPNITKTSFSRAIEDLCYEFALKWDPNLYRKRSQNMFKALNKAINELNIPCYGVHTTLLSDIAAIFCGHSILNVDDKGVWQYYGIGDAGNVDMEVYIQAIKDLKEEEGVTADEKAYAIKAIKGIAPGISVAPVTDEFTRGNEGSDWDSDSIFIFYLMRLLRSHVAKQLKKPEGEGATDDEINKWIEGKIQGLIKFFSQDERCETLVAYLKLAKAAKLSGEVDVALRYPNNHCEGICRLSESFIPEMLSVRIVEGTSKLDKEFDAPDTFRGDLLRQFNALRLGKIKEVEGMFPHLNQTYSCGMVQFTRYIITGIDPPGVYISAMNIHADARFAADRLLRMCKATKERLNCRRIIEQLDAKEKELAKKDKKLSAKEQVILDSAKFLLDYAAIIFGVRVDDYMEVMKNPSIGDAKKKEYKYKRYTFELVGDKEKDRCYSRPYITPFNYDKNKINGVLSVTVSLNTSNKVVKRAQLIDPEIYVDDIFKVARDCEAVKRNGGEILIDSPKGIKDSSIMVGLPLSRCRFVRQFNTNFEVVQRYVGDSFKDTKYPKPIRGGYDDLDGGYDDDLEEYTDVDGCDFVEDYFGEYGDDQDCCESSVRQRVKPKIDNQGGFTGEYVVLIDDKDGQPAGNGNKKLKIAPGWCYNNQEKVGWYGKKFPIGRTEPIEHYNLYDIAQQRSYRSCVGKLATPVGTAVDPLFRIMIACLGYLPAVAEKVVKKTEEFSLPDAELEAMSTWSSGALALLQEYDTKAEILDAQKALFNIKGVWADINGGLAKEEEAIKKIFAERIKGGFASQKDLEDAIKFHRSLNTMAYRGCENMARLLMEKMGESSIIGRTFKDNTLNQMRFTVQTLMDKGTSGIVSDFGRLVMPEEFAIWQYYVTQKYGNSGVPKWTKDQLHFIGSFKEVMTPERLKKLHGKRVKLVNGCLVSREGICWACSKDPEMNGEFILSVEGDKLYAHTDIYALMDKWLPAADQNQRCVQLWGKANMKGATQRGRSMTTCTINRDKVMELLRDHDYVYIDAEDMERLLVFENGKFVTVGKIKCAYTFDTNMAHGNSKFYKSLLLSEKRANWEVLKAQLLKGKIKVALPCEKGSGLKEYKTVGLVLEDIEATTYDWKANGYYDNSFELVQEVVSRPAATATATATTAATVTEETVEKLEMSRKGTSSGSNGGEGEGDDDEKISGRNIINPSDLPKEDQEIKKKDFYGEGEPD